MADISATQDATTQDQMTLRRRARRRLVGAIAFALTAVLILPMLFDPDPRPLGPDVDIRIPAPSTPFEALPAVPARPVVTAKEAPPQEAEPTLSVVAPEAATVKPQTPVAPQSVEPASDDESVAKAATLKNNGEKAGAQEDEQPKSVEKVKPVEKAKAVEKAKPLPKPSGPFASHGFYLQLGVFASASNAGQLREKVEEAGFKVDLLTSNDQYRVRVGPFPERDRAQEVQSRLKAHGFTSVLLGP